MNKQDLINAAEHFVATSPGNYIDQKIAISSNVVGLKIYDPPIFGFAGADDELFERLSRLDENLKYFLPPEKWLAGSRTVVSFFLPFSKIINESNKKDRRFPSEGWLHGRVEGQLLINNLCIHLKNQLFEAGYESLAPSLDRRFWSREKSDPGTPFPDASYTSNWSERHVAYICGLGTFGLSKGLITRKGISGRFGSLITTLYLSPDKREYTGIYDYCAMCGECAARCPVKAISLEKGKAHDPCAAFIKYTRKKFDPRYGCGKCQVGVPCEHRIPPKQQ